MRYTIGDASRDQLLETIRRDLYDLAIVRLPTARFDLANALLDEPGAILCDCLVYYQRDNEKVGFPVKPHAVGWSERLASADDAPLLDRMVAAIFENYPNHYSSNPLLADFPVVAGYQEWVRSFVDSPDRAVIIAEVGSVATAFASVEFKDTASEGVLIGVLPAYQGRGLYKDLIRAVVRWFMERGSTRTVISTQIDNRRVQGVWASEWFRMSGSYFTIHINRP